jgi:Protein of unknown function (DUF2971)
MTPNKPSRLYHYTDVAGLIGILEHQVLWATDAEFLNDAQELQFGRTGLLDALHLRASELSTGETHDDHPAYPDPLAYTTASMMLGAAERIQPGTRHDEYFHVAVYVSCFCEEADLLSQWRGYAAGGGFAIGFSSSALAQLQPLETDVPARVRLARAAAESESSNSPESYRPPALPVRLAPVRYGDSAVAGLIDDVLGELTPSRPTGHPGVKGLYLGQTLVMPALATVKHDAFAEEKEWRLIVVSAERTERVAFRSGGLGVIPYIELGFEPAAIEEVVIGPGAEGPLRERGLQRLLAAVGLQDVVIRQSEAPYRG